MNGRTNVTTQENQDGLIGAGIPLNSPINLVADAGNAQVSLTWSDPLDKYAAPEGDVAQSPNQLVSQWDHTVLIRKEGSQPQGPEDGSVVISSTMRNQYQSSPYVDVGLTNDVTYHYGAFAYNTANVHSSGVFASAFPKAGTFITKFPEGTVIKIKEDGAPIEYIIAKFDYEPELNGAGRTLVVRKSPITMSSTWTSVGTRFCPYRNSNIARDATNYISHFSEYTKSLIGSTTFYSQATHREDPASTWSTSVFLLSGSEYDLENTSTRQYGTAYGNDGTALPTAQLIVSYRSTKSSTYTATRSMDMQYADESSSYEYDPIGIDWINRYNRNSASRGVSRYGNICFTIPSDCTVSDDMVLMES